VKSNDKLLQGFSKDCIEKLTGNWQHKRDKHSVRLTSGNRLLANQVFVRFWARMTGHCIQAKAYCQLKTGDW